VLIFIINEGQIGIHHTYQEEKKDTHRARLEVKDAKAPLEAAHAVPAVMPCCVAGHGRDIDDPPEARRFSKCGGRKGGWMG